ncbi:DUF397 domain-containing protein [Streptomyces sp. NPDC001920]
MNTTALTWFKSSYSGTDEPDCVEIAISPTGATIHIRDSKDRNGAHLTFADGVWAEFVKQMPARS